MMECGKMTSEFGKGLSYCLALFLCHSERSYGVKGKETEILNRPDLWFYGAADHLFELQIPNGLSLNLRKRLAKFKSKVLGWRLSMGDEKQPTQEDKLWSIQEAKDLIRLIDKHFGVKTQRGDWE